MIRDITYQGAKSVTFYSTVTFLTFFGLLTNKNSNTQGLCHSGTVSFSLTQQRTIQASVKLTALFCTLPLNVPWPIKLGHRALCKVVQQRYPLKVYLNKLNSFEALFCQLLLPLLSRPRANYFPPWTRIKSDTKFRVSKYCTNSFVCLLGESTARQSAYVFIWPLRIDKPKYILERKTKQQKDVTEDRHDIL